jgi:hypothetical protein
VSTSLPRSVSAIQPSQDFPVARVSEIRRPWVWWHLLSLDAPTVAVVWCWFFGAVFGLHYSSTTLPTLALGTWCVYVADRLLDGWRSTDIAALRDRHWFYLRHRKPFLIAWCIAAIPLAYLIFFRAQPAVRTDDIILCMIGIAYFLFVHGSSAGKSPLFARASRWISKELAVGFLFAIATAVPAWARLHGERNILLAATLVFGAACWLNCVAIQTWEDDEAAHELVHTILSPASRVQRGFSSHSVTQFLGAHRTAFAVTVGLLGILFAIRTMDGSAYPLFACVAVSAAIFLALARNSYRFSALSLRIAADAALLTPLLFLLRVR